MALNLAASRWGWHSSVRKSFGPLHLRHRKTHRSSATTPRDIRSTPSANRRTEFWTERKEKWKVFILRQQFERAGQACKLKSFYATNSEGKRKHGLSNKGNPLLDGMEMISALSEQQWSAKWKQKLIYRNVYKQVTFVRSFFEAFLDESAWLTDVLGRLATLHLPSERRSTVKNVMTNDETQTGKRQTRPRPALFWWIRCHSSLLESRSSINVATSDPLSGTAVGPGTILLHHEIKHSMMLESIARLERTTEARNQIFKRNHQILKFNSIDKPKKIEFPAKFFMLQTRVIEFDSKKFILFCFRVQGMFNSKFPEQEMRFSSSFEEFCFIILATRNEFSWWKKK